MLDLGDERWKERLVKYWNGEVVKEFRVKIINP